MPPSNLHVIGLEVLEVGLDVLDLLREFVHALVEGVIGSSHLTLRFVELFLGRARISLSSIISLEMT